MKAKGSPQSRSFSEDGAQGVDLHAWDSVDPLSAKEPEIILSRAAE